MNVGVKCCHFSNMNRSFKHKKEQMPQLSITRLEQLRTLFNRKRWPIDEKIELSVFERFYNTLAMLEDNEQGFLIELSYRFDHIPLSNYLQLLINPLRQLREDAEDKKLFFVTCTPKEDVGSVKSSSTVLYQLKGTTIKQHVDISPKVIVDNITKLPQYSINNNSIVVLVDDFIGTGDTAVGAVNYIHELVPGLNNNSQIVLLCLVALYQGVERLRSMGVKTYQAIERRKAITEEMSGVNKDTAVALMEGIENKIKKLKKEYKFGYKGSEALVCLERCPNNTFPIYWLTKDIAPYERG